MLEIRFCGVLICCVPQRQKGAWLVKRKTAVWAFRISRQHSNIPTNSVIYSKPRGIYTGWKTKEKNRSERLYGGKQHRDTHKSYKRQNTRFNFLEKPKNQRFLQGGDLVSFSSFSDSWRFVDTGSQGTSAKTLPTQPVARRATLKTTRSRWKLLWGPSMVTTALVVKAMTFHL